MRRHNDRLHYELPDRNDRAQNEECVNYCFDQASILVFRLRLHDKIVSCRFMGVHRLPSPMHPPCHGFFASRKTLRSCCLKCSGEIRRHRNHSALGKWPSRKWNRNALPKACSAVTGGREFELIEILPPDGGSYNKELKRIKYSLPQNRTQHFSVCAPRRFVTRRRK